MYTGVYKWSLNTLNSQKGIDSGEGGFTLGESRVAGEDKGSVEKPMPKTAEGRQTKLAKPASAYSSQPKIPPAVLQKVLQKQGPSVGYPRIGGPDSAWN